MRMYFKRAVALLLIVLMLIGTTSCAPSKKKLFEDEAKAYFEGFTEGNEFEATTVIEYNKELGSVAYELPVTGIPELDSDIKVYYETVIDVFRSAVTGEEDKAFISYRAYTPCPEICGVEVTSSDTLAGLTTIMRKSFNYNKMAVSGEEMPSNLRRLTLIHAKDEFKGMELPDKEPAMLYTDKGIEISYTDIEGAQTVIPYEKLYYSLPDSMKQTIAPDKSARAIDLDKKMVALTFDDGPHGVYTDEILDILEQYGAVATFFEVGQNLSAYPDAVKRAYNMGCELGSHSWSHANLQTSSADKIRSELEKTNAKFKEIIGEVPTLMRPPYGAVGSDLRSISEQYLIGWSVDTLDWKTRNAASVIDSVKSQRSLDGDVILMHSLYKSTVDAVEELVPWLIENGYQLVTVSELMKFGEEDTFETGKYYNFG